MNLFQKYSADNPTNKKRMTVAFAFAKPSHMLASFFGSGCIRPAPGTWGTLAGWVVFLLVNPYISVAVAWSAVAICFIAGAWASQQTSDDLGVSDHGSIVIDEVFAVWAVLLTVPAQWPWQLAAFVAFRFFDIVKCPPANYCDCHFKNGWGIMIDDAVAALWAIATLALAQYVLGVL